MDKTQMCIDEQVEYLMRGTEYGDEDLKQAMKNELRQRLLEAKQEERPLRVYCGYDPTKPDLTLGHTITMRKLAQFQELGHEVTFLIGNYTSLIGDPSDKDKTRPILSPEQVAQNGLTYAEQAFHVLDRSKTLLRYNADWLSKLTFERLIYLCSNFTVQQFITRENFKLRWENGDPIFVHEFFYAIMQGYDAYSMKADVQVGGTDQLFNIITAARKIMTFLGEKPNIGIIMGILPGTDGEVKMSKSMGNYIPINTTSDDMYGKLMSVPDKAMPQYYRLVTRWSVAEIDVLEREIASGKLHPRDAKMKMAREVTEIFYGVEAAQRAEDNFISVFQKGSLPDEMPEYMIKAGQTVLDVLLEGNLAGSKSEGRRLLEQKGVRLDGVTLTDANQVFPHPGVLQAGKRKYLRVISK
ncbi:MAG: tyrosine--tRNA ligase [Anaerolineales bacterium]|nr:tyrosine--tRNA ligase [Anaerolineae bacterium]PWB53516.1 MAG: tyrosine--tRNA ligase [Anaerolineales bacterium]